jgi:hypothetical protein
LHALPPHLLLHNQRLLPEHECLLHLRHLLLIRLAHSAGMLEMGSGTCEPVSHLVTLSKHGQGTEQQARDCANPGCLVHRSLLGAKQVSAANLWAKLT